MLVQRGQHCCSEATAADGIGFLWADAMGMALSSGEEGQGASLLWCSCRMLWARLCCAVQVLTPRTVCIGSSMHKL